MREMVEEGERVLKLTSASIDLRHSRRESSSLISANYDPLLLNTGSSLQIRKHRDCQKERWEEHDTIVDMIHCYSILGFSCKKKKKI